MDPFTRKQRLHAASGKPVGTVPHTPVSRPAAYFTENSIGSKSKTGVAQRQRRNSGFVIENVPDAAALLEKRMDQ